MKRYLFTLLLIFAGVAHTLADEIKLTIQAPQATVKGGQVQLRYILRGGDADDIQLGTSSIKGFSLIYGPSIATHQEYSNINGKVTNDSYVVYTYTLLAQETGTFTMPSATVKVGGRNYSSGTAQIKVLPPDKNAQQRPGQQPDIINSTSNNGTIDPKDAFVRAAFSRTKVHEQEAVMVTFKFYTTLDFRGVKRVQFPEFEGFMAEEVELPLNRQLKFEHLNGRNYGVIDVKQTLLFPQRSGKLTIPAGVIDFVFVVKSGQKRQDIFGRTYDVPMEVQKSLKIAPVTVDVSQLPLDGKPANFSGAVGSFSFSSNLSAQKIKANEQVTLKLNITGTGNMKLIKNPDVKLPEEFEAYDPKIDNDKLKITENGLSGTKTIEYMFIPRQAGEYTIPPIEFNYFDTKTQSYKTLTSPSYKMTIDKDPNAGKNNSATSYMNQNAVQKMKDILYLKTGDFKFGRADNFLFGSLSNILWYIIPLLLFGALAIMYRKQIKANADIAGTKNKKANKVAIKRLKLANKYLKENNKEGFYEEVLRATWGYLSDKLTIPVANLNRENIELELSKYGVDETLTKSFISILDTCEFARYAPSSAGNAMDKLYEETVDSIGKMENLIKIKK